MSYFMGDMPEYGTVGSILASTPAKRARIAARARARAGARARGAVARVLSGLGGVTSSPRGPRVSLLAMGGPDTFSASTPCSSIPAGDAYRTPGNQCLANDGHTVMDFDAQGNVYAPTPITTYLLVGAAALAAVHFLK